MFDIFISHSSLDKSTFVEPLVSELKNLGLQVWYDKFSIHKGDKMKDSILNGIEESVTFVAIISKNYYHSNWANLELGILQANYPNNCLPIVFPDVKKQTALKYPFLLDYNYIEVSKTIREIAIELNETVSEKKQDCGLWHIEKTDLTSLIKDGHSYNSFKLDRVAIHLNRVVKNIHSDLLSALNEIKLILDFILIDVATFENIYISPETSAIDAFLKIDFLGINLKEHFQYLQRLYQVRVRSFIENNRLSQEELYLAQFSLYSVVEWYMITYFRRPILKPKKIVPVAPEDIGDTDIIEAYNIEQLVLPPNLIASPSTVMEWYNYNPLIIIGARDTESGKLVGFFNTLPVSDEVYKKIRSGCFDDTCFSSNDIRQYDIPGFYKLYLCSFCIDPAYNSTTAFKTIYTGFIDFLLNLAVEREIYISDIVADAVTPKGSSLCESIGMTKVTASIHNSTVYEAPLIPPAYTTLKLNNMIGHKLIAYYEKMYNEYKEIF